MKILIFAIMSFYLHSLFASKYVLSENGNRLIGTNLHFIIPNNNTHSLEYFSEKFHIGLRNMLQANPDIDLYLPASGKQLIIPKQLILPDTPHIGIIINTAEMRLYYYPKRGNIVTILPISIGTPGHETPSNWITSVKYKKKNPVWIPTKDMHREYIQRGKILPKIFPMGPNNPMGSYALYLGQNYAIHGTNNDAGIGLRMTRGCVRLRSEDIKYLYTLTSVGTRVQFIHEPVKITTDSKGVQYLEIHNTLLENSIENQTNYLNQLKQHVYFILKNIPNIDYSVVNKALEERSGIPIKITVCSNKQNP